MTQQGLTLVQQPQPQALSQMPSASEWQVITQMANVLIKSGLVPDEARSPEKVIAIMLKARELGVPPMQALSSIYIVKGKPTLSADLMVALVRREGHKVWVVETSNERCVMGGHRRGEENRPIEVTFTLDDAKRAGLLDSQTWKKFTAAMLYARCASRIAKMIDPGALAGIYTPEEMGATVTVNTDGQQEVVSFPMPEITQMPVRRIGPHPAQIAEIKRLAGELGWDNASVSAFVLNEFAEEIKAGRNVSGVRDLDNSECETLINVLLNLVAADEAETALTLPSAADTDEF